MILVYNESTFRRQLHWMERNLDKAKQEFSFFKKKAKSADGHSTEEETGYESQESRGVS